MKSKKQIVLGVLLILWMIVVFMFSHQNDVESTNTSNIIVDKVIELCGITDIEQIEMVQFFIRKLAHFTLYMTGGVIIFLWITTFPSMNRKILISQMIGTLYAVSDEFHQSFIPGRSGEIRDIIIDSAGVFVGIWLCYLMIKMHQKKDERGQINGIIK